ncbi:carboxypeptidase-like regulatory domain-containing protein [Flavobacterium zepuense]|uniref:Carboxypeptidase-like regulatory domain-containing protein n=2 Tax=Flavobacterium zepuense TaxID=2593302 RepID=A0A552V868_9FLAO|nr:carboxypeptidase-like regulatory domain-containing protein [Flavobacterium zepuense]
MRLLNFLFLLITISMGAQTAITVTVKDAQNNTGLPFATVTSQGRNYITDVDGKLVLEEPSAIITASYTSYTSQNIEITPTRRFYTIKLVAHSEVLKELVIEGANPANEIMGRAIRRKVINDPQRKLSSFTYKTYDRLIVTADPDSISSKLDSVFVYEKIGKRFAKVDSTGFKFKKLIDRRHLYQTEKISEYKFNRGQGLKQEVLATRMAGFKQPLYEFIGLKLQSYSVYTDKIDLLETKYAGPMANDALSEYNYKILDTVSINKRQAYMIYFVPKHRGKKKLSGILYIDTYNYGVAKAVFRVRNVLDITSTHFFTYEKDQQLWFPDRKTLKIVKGNNKEDIKILGETIKFDAVSSQDAKREKEPSDFVYMYSESDNFDKHFNEPVTIRRSSVAIEIKDDAINRPESYWNQFRPDTLDSRSMTTYMALDSLVAKDNWEQRIILGRRIINGYIPLGPIDLDLKQIVKYNNYEGFRLGVGFITNDKFAETFRINTYGAYGTKDGEFKYSLGGAVRLGKFSNSWIGGSYTDDIKEIASTSFATDKRVFKIYDPRPINISTFYNYQQWQGYIETRIIPKTESVWQLTRSRIDPKFDYVYNPTGVLPYSVFNLTTASVSLQWNPFSDFMQTPRGRIEVEKRFPKFAFQYTQAVSGIWESDFNFGKFDFRAEFEHKYLNGQKTTALVQTGLALGDTPLTHLYSTSPNNLDREGVLARITFAGKNSFETMYFNEFFSSRYMMLQVKHGITRFTIFRSLKLSPMLVTRFAIGGLDHKNQHTGLDYKTLDDGYYESGVEFNEIFKGLGFTAFYRYGPYQLPAFDRNIALKISYVLNLF